MSFDLVRCGDLCNPAPDAAALIGGPGNRLIEAFPAETFDCRAPFNLGDDEQSRQFRETSAFPRYGERHGAGAVCLAGLEDATLATPQALVFADDGRLLAESYHNEEMVPLALKETSELAERLMSDPPSRTLDETCLLLAGPWSWNYHHWIFEDLTRLWAVEQFPDLSNLPVIVPATFARFHEQSLQAMGIDPARLTYFDGGRWQCRRLIVPTFLAPCGHSARQMNWLRQRLFAGLDVAASETGNRRLYVVRRGARARELINEDQVAGILVSRGFEIVDPGAMALAEQAALFAGAGMVAGASGAGLSNVLFAPPRTALIEFQPDSFVNIAHWYVTNALGQDYGFVIGPTETDRHDFSISLDRLAAALDAAESARA